MKVSISGVLADGTGNFAPAQQTISIPQGADVTVAIAVTHADGTALDLTTYMLKLVARTAASGGQVVAQIDGTTTSAAAGLAQFVLPSALTKGLLGTYTYDVFATSSTPARDEVVLASTLEVFAAPGA